MSTRARLEAGPRPDGLPFDPWPRLGGRIQRVEPESLRISGTVAQWQAWVGMAFRTAGALRSPGGLALLQVDREADTGLYLL